MYVALQATVCCARKRNSFLIIVMGATCMKWDEREGSGMLLLLMVADLRLRSQSNTHTHSSPKASNNAQGIRHVLLV